MKDRICNNNCLTVQVSNFFSHLNWELRKEVKVGVALYKSVWVYLCISQKALPFCLLSGQLVQSLFWFFIINIFLSFLQKKKIQLIFFYHIFLVTPWSMKSVSLMRSMRREEDDKEVSITFYLLKITLPFTHDEITVIGEGWIFVRNRFPTISKGPMLDQFGIPSTRMQTILLEL